MKFKFLILILFVLILSSCISSERDESGDYKITYLFTIKGNEVYKVQGIGHSYHYISIIPVDNGETKNVKIYKTDMFDFLDKDKTPDVDETNSNEYKTTDINNEKNTDSLDK